MNGMEKYLAELGLDPMARPSPEDVKKAWRKKANEHHPDKGGKSDDFVRVTHAYKMLTDPSYRIEQEHKKHPARPEINIQMQVPCTFEEAFFGKTINISYNRIEIGADFKPVVKEEQEILHIDFSIPQGCFEGHQVVREGMGLKFGDDFGRVIIRVIPQAHPRFRTHGLDIVTQDKVPLNVMLKGGEIEVQTMYGLRTLRVPAGTQPGAKLIIRNCGVMKQGNHIVVVEPVFPDRKDLKDEAWKGLDINWDLKENEEDVTMERMYERLRSGIQMDDLDDLFGSGGSPRRRRR